MKPHRIYGINQIDPKAVNQFYEAMKQDWVVMGALMPDSHLGYALPIGAVVGTKDVVVPAWVGYDIGCGVAAVQVKGLHPLHVMNHQDKIFDGIYKRVPVGFKHHEAHQPRWNGVMLYPHTQWLHKVFMDGGLQQLGTLGGGNHFIEISGTTDEEVWIVVHSGSRNIGHKTATHYMKAATGDGKAREGHYPMKANTGMGSQYVSDMNFCMEFAQENRIRMLHSVVRALGWACPDTHPWLDPTTLINRTHNHVVYEHDMWIHRKGATHAEKDMLGVIPGNMRDGSWIVKGLGNPLSLWSSSHGAGRRFSRRQARENLDMEDFQTHMRGIKAKVERSTLDESPGAYKTFGIVMREQQTLVQLVKHLKPIINIKG